MLVLFINPVQDLFLIRIVCFKAVILKIYSIRDVAGNQARGKVDRIVQPDIFIQFMHGLFRTGCCEGELTHLFIKEKEKGHFLPRRLNGRCSSPLWGSACAGAGGENRLDALNLSLTAASTTFPVWRLCYLHISVLDKQRLCVPLILSKISKCFSPKCQTVLSWPFKAGTSCGLHNAAWEEISNKSKVQAWKPMTKTDCVMPLLGIKKGVT